MAYTSNPHIGKTRRKAVNDVIKHGYSVVKMARYYGIHRTTLYRWIKKAPKDHRVYIHTIPSRPKRCWKQLPQDIVDKVIAERTRTKRCAQIVHAQLLRDGVLVSLSSVKRIIKRYHLTRAKKRQTNPGSRFKRPASNQAGSLVQVDTIHFIRPDYSRFYIYAIIDTYSRIAYAEYQTTLSTSTTVEVLKRALSKLTLPVQVIQTDNGKEFSSYLATFLSQHNIRLRHTRVRKPNDNAHLERFIRTIQEECFDGRTPNEDTVQQEILNYLEYYNNHRLHLGINCLTPSLFVSKLLT